MKLENQVVSLELSQKLKELGVKQESLFYWCGNPGVEYRLSPTDKGHRIETGGNGMFCSAYTVAELGEMFLLGNENGWKIHTYRCTQDTFWIAVPQQKKKQPHSLMFSGDTEADARAKMLIYLLENKLIAL